MHRESPTGRPSVLQLNDHSLDFPSIAAGAVGTLTATVPGAAIGDGVVVNARSALTAGLVIVDTHVSAADTVSVSLLNTTANPVDEAATDFDIYVIKNLAPS